MIPFFYTPLGMIVAFLIIVFILKSGVEIIEGVINAIIGFVGCALLIAGFFIIVLTLITGGLR